MNTITARQYFSTFWMKRLLEFLFKSWFANYFMTTEWEFRNFSVTQILPKMIILTFWKNLRQCEFFGKTKKSEPPKLSTFYVKSISPIFKPLLNDFDSFLGSEYLLFRIFWPLKIAQLVQNHISEPKNCLNL